MEGEGNHSPSLSSSPNNDHDLSAVGVDKVRHSGFRRMRKEEMEGERRRVVMMMMGSDLSSTSSLSKHGASINGHSWLSTKRGGFSSRNLFEMSLAVLVVVQLILSGQSALAQYQPPQTDDGAWNTADYYKREHSLSKPYQGAGWQIPNWDFQGTTIVTNQYIRLTPDLRSQQGSIWNAAPVRMHNWEVQVQVKVHGKGKDLFGDGMVFWYARDRMIPGPIFGSKDYFMGLAVFIDTYSNHNGPHNHQHPYVSAMVNNGTMHYDHDRDGTHTQLAGCEAKLRNIDLDSWLAIRYENEVLTVSTDFQGKNAWAPCLRVEGVKLPTGYYFGATAATGDLSDNHDVITIKTYELESGVARPEDDRSRDSIIPSAETFEAPREHVEDVKPGWSGVKIFFVTLFSILGVVAIGVIGIIVYQNHQQNSRKRFY